VEQVRLEPMLREGATLDRYRIEAEIGSGGMGRVYRAFDTRLHRRIALKVLITPGLDGEERAEAVARLIREARAAASLNHPNVVGIFDAGESAGTPYIAMEYVSGTSLMRRVGDRSVPWEERVRWITDVARALGAAHRAGLVHRDVKPANVIVRDDGAVKVLDFGIAHIGVHDLSRLLQTTGENLLAAADATILGTPLYMAPEQLRGDVVDARADQFAWGVLAYELLAGRTPWQAAGAVSVIGMILSKDPRPLCEIARELPSAIGDVVMRALRKPPEARFGEMEDIVEELEPWVASAPAPTSLRLLGKPVSSRRPSSGSFHAVSDPTAQAKTSYPPLPVVNDGRALTGASYVPPAPITLTEADVQPSSASIARMGDDGVTPPAVGLSTTSHSLSVPPPSSAQRRITPFGAPSDEVTPPSASASGGDVHSTPKWRRPIVAAMLGALGVAAGISAVAVVGGHEPEIRRASTPALLPVATTLRDLPRPEPCSDEASEAYMDALRLSHEGDDEQAVRRLEVATRLDAGCAAAPLRLVIVGSQFMAPARLQETYQQAVKLRAKLSPRDQGLLDVYEPIMMRDPPDRSELSARLLALADRFPADAEVLALTASESRASLEERLLYATRAVAIDPQYGGGLQRVGDLLARMGREPEALEVLETCTRAAPLSIDCLWQRSDITRASGRCEELELDARRMIARSPATSQGYALLADALVAQGSGVEAVREVLEKRWQRLGDDERGRERVFDEVALAILEGGFDRAEERARELDRLSHGTSEMAERARSARYLAETLIEAGKGDEASRVAGEFVRRRRAWGRRMDVLASRLRGHFYDEIALLAQARDRGQLGEVSWRKEIERWREASLVSLKLDERLVWAVSVAMPVRTKVEADAALAAFPGAPPSWLEAPAADGEPASAPRLSVSFERAGYPDIFTGRALHLAGKDLAAVAYLRRGIKACTALDDPFLHTRAHLWLGQALERAGEKASACEAYGVVVQRWGKAKPGSKTADEARSKARALACGQ
jgi:serine/threonine-protein kinase